MFEEQNANKGLPMKHPFWILNSLLFFLLLFVMGFIYIFRYPLPEKETIELTTVALPATKEKLHINIAKIYEHDIFDTYKEEVPVVEEESQLIEPLPEPPKSIPVSIPELPEPQFLDQINITLKGIVVFNTDNSKNRAIIEDNKTKEENVYSTGDSIEDARLIRIFSNKIIIVRSNGQQEVLYLREEDAKNDPTYITIDQWDAAIKKITDSEYTIDVKEFISRINNLGQLVDTLGLTTAYERGVSVGCKIGKLDEKSVGPQMGLKSGDIILSINKIPADTTENRLAIYQQIMLLGNNSIVDVSIRRNNNEQKIHYTLQMADDTLKEKETEASQNKAENKASENKAPESKEKSEKNRFSDLRARYSFAPTMKEIRMREKQQMLTKGKRKNSVSTNINE